MTQRILVTGGGGFLGATLVRRLLEYKREKGADFHVTSMDLLPSPVEGADHVIGSILDSCDLARSMRDCDMVVHMAALLGVENTERRRLDCLRINIQGTINVLNACALDRVRKIVFASSSEVYGDQEVLPITEDNPVNPKSIYAVTKLAGEAYVRAYSERYGMNHTVLRFFNSYGTLQVGQFVIARFVRAVLNDESPLLSGDGGQVRCFCSGNDIADGVISAMFSDRADGETINLGNDREPVTMRDLAERVIRLSGRTHLKTRVASSEQMDRTPERDIRRRSPSIEKARRLLNYEPRISLDEGIKEILSSGRVSESWRERQ